MMIVYKKAYTKPKNGFGTEVVVTLYVPKDAVVIKSTSYLSYDHYLSKQRCNKAKVLSIRYLGGGEVHKTTKVVSAHDTSFVYSIGKWVKPKTFNNHKSEQCGGGIHFFTRKDFAKDY